MSPIEGPKARLLLRLMHALSEEYFCAQWLTDCEYALWADLTGTEVRGRKGWGISTEEKEELQLLHELAGGWIMWSAEARDEVWLSTEEWLDHLSLMSEAHVERH